MGPVGGGRNFQWWRRDARILASVPVILFFSGLLAALLTAIFMVEAFVTQLYTGPGAQYIVSIFISYSIPSNLSCTSHSPRRSCSLHLFRVC